MAEQSSQDEIMPLLKMKQLLGLAEKDKLACAFGLTKDKKEVLLLIEKIGKPKKAAEILKKDGKAFLDLGTLRFGEVNIDLPNDPATVRFNVNRSEAGGTVMLMVKLIKKAGYQGIVINTDPGLDADDVPAVPAAAGGADASAVPAPPGGVGASAVPPPPPPPGGDAAAAAFAKSSQLWRSCRTQAQTKVGQLKTAILTAYADQPEVAAELQKNMGKLDQAVEGLDARLETTLDAATKVADPAQRHLLAEQSRALIAGYIKYVATDATLQALDENPFGVQLGLKDTFSKVLAALVGLSKSYA
jgi:hypothetical protein